VNRGVLVVMLLALSGRAHAEDIVAYEAEGDAPVAGAEARSAALDDAFARAVGSALADLVAGDVRTAHKGELDKEIVTHARLWVVRFTVTKDDTEDDRRQLTVSVRIDRDKIKARLDELKIQTKDVSAPVGDPAQRSVTILLRVATPKGPHASFGKNSDHDTMGLGGLATLFRSAGMAVRRAPDSGTALDGDYPVADADVDGLGDAAKADLVAIAGVSVGDPANVRGRSQPAVLATAHLKLFDRKAHRVIGQGTAIAAGDPQYAIDRALAAAAADLLPPQPKKLAQAGSFTGDDTPLTDAGIVLVRLSSKTPYSMVLTEQRYLAGAKGVHAASLRRLSPNGWVIGVTTADSIERVAQIAKKPPATDTSASVKIVGDVVEVTLSGSP